MKVGILKQGEAGWCVVHKEPMRVDGSSDVFYYEIMECIEFERINGAEVEFELIDNKYVIKLRVI